MAQQRYHVLERIDAGGMAEVFKANSTSLQGFEKLVAIKRILPKLAQNERFVRMFLDEAKLSLHLSHTNCVQVFDLGLADGTYFIVMEFVDGVNLKHLIEESRAQKRPIPLEQSVYVGLEICKGLAHAHEKTDQQGRHLAIVHRDISPPNILISREGEVKITDFGLAKAKSQVETTDPGVVKGKFGYLSPEAAHGEDVDARTDVFAVGILLWEMLTGTRLFLGETDLDTLQQVRKNAVPSFSKYRSDVPHRLEKIIRRALASDLDARYQTVKALGQDLAAFLFANGKSVTSFDIANWAREIRDKQPRQDRSQRDKAVEEAVQEAVNRIVTLEEIDDLDRFMAEQYESLPDQGANLDLEGGGEDPRMWADIGFGDVDFSVREQQGSDAWEERNLEDLIRSGQTVDPLTMELDLPADIPDDSTIEISDMGGQLRADAMRTATLMNEEAKARSSETAPEIPSPPLSAPDPISQAMAQVQSSPDEEAVPVVPESEPEVAAAPAPKSSSPPVGMVVIVVILIALVAAGVLFSGVL